MDYNSTELNTKTLTADNNSVSFGLPSWIAVRYIDAVFRVTGTIPTSVTVTQASTVNSVSFIKIAEGLYRVYGKLTGSSSSLVFTFNTTGTTYVNVESMHASTTAYSRTDIEAYCEIVNADMSETIHYVPTDEINHRFVAGPDTMPDTWFQLYIWTDNWKKYDYIDFQFLLDVFDITSITAVMGSTNVPLDISHLSATDLGYDSFVYSMRMDITGLDRTSSDYPMIIVMGKLDPSYTDTIDFLNCAGYIAVADFNPLFVFLNRIQTSISSGFSNLSSWISAQTSAIVSAITGDTTSADDFQDEADDLLSDLDNSQIILDSVNRPDMDTIDTPDVESVGTNGVRLVGQVFSITMDSGGLGTMFVVAMLVSTVAYVLYGKR